MGGDERDMQAPATDYEVSTDPSRLDVDVIHRFLSQESYWSRGISRDAVVRSIRHSLCFGVYLGAAQVGFARVVTDYTTFGLLADVFILPAHRGLGLSKRLMACIVAHEELKGLRRLTLRTSDAQELYRQFGFQEITDPERCMEIFRPDALHAT